MSKWISVEDRLPEKLDHNHWSKFVLGYCEYTKSQYTVVYNHNLKLFEYASSRIMVYGGITHWMPLPEPPKQ